MKFKNTEYELNNFNMILAREAISASQSPLPAEEETVSSKERSRRSSNVNFMISKRPSDQHTPSTKLSQQHAHLTEIPHEYSYPKSNKTHQHYDQSTIPGGTSHVYSNPNPTACTYSPNQNTTSQCKYQICLKLDRNINKCSNLDHIYNISSNSDHTYNKFSNSNEAESRMSQNQPMATKTSRRCPSPASSAQPWRSVIRSISGSNPWLLLALVSILVNLANCEDIILWPRPGPVGVTPTQGPELNFKEQPANTSVVEGDIAIMKCKANKPVHHCRWYYIEIDGSFNDENSQPKLVKQFEPSSDNDCSIRFTKVRKVQEGQWLCQARKFMGTTHLNTRPAFLHVITELDEKNHANASGQEPPTPTPPTDVGPTTRDPTAPTAIPALGPPPSLGPLPFPPRGPLVPHPPGEGDPPAEGERPQDEEKRLPPSEVDEPSRPRFNYSSDDHIQNTEMGATATLPCFVNSAVSSCAWVMPNTALFVWSDADASVGRSFSLNTPVLPRGGGDEAGGDYEFVGDRAVGDCSLRVRSVQPHDEGNWRCVVSTRAPGQSPPVHRAFAAVEPAPQVDFQGPLIHLHLLDFHHGVHLDDAPEPKPGPNTTLIVLFMVGLVLFAVGAIVIYCCYKRVWSKPEDNSKIIETRNSDSEYSQQWFQGRNLKISDPNYTDDFKLRNATMSANDCNLKNVDAMNLKNAAVKYTDIDHYNQYLNMKQSGLASARSSASSNTTLSTMAPDPYGQERPVGFSPSVSMSPSSNVSGVVVPGHGMVSPEVIPNGHAPNETIPFYELHRQLQRPVSLYSTSHVYEEIEDKIPAHQKGMPQIIGRDGNGVLFQAHPLPNGQIATTPVYTNVVEDHDGYLIPNKSAKIINTPTGEEPIQYLPMKGEAVGEAIRHPTHPQQNAFIPSMNNLSMHQEPTVHQQILDEEENAAAMVTQRRRKSNESTLSDENNYSPEDNRTSHENPNLQESTPVKRSPHKSASVTPTSKRQKMPLPVAPIEQLSTSKSDPNDTIQSVNSSEISRNSSGMPETVSIGRTTHNNASNETPRVMASVNSSRKNGSSGTPEGIYPGGSAPTASQVPSSVGNDSTHLRTTSLPDTSNRISPAIRHSKTPSLVPAPENYDVPRSLDAVPRSVNGSEISLDDIDGTIV